MVTAPHTILAIQMLRRSRLTQRHLFWRWMAWSLSRSATWLRPRAGRWWGRRRFCRWSWRHASVVKDGDQSRASVKRDSLNCLRILSEVNGAKRWAIAKCIWFDEENDGKKSAVSLIQQKNVFYEIELTTVLIERELIDKQMIND